ncbi:hypothetical protein TL16_g06118 [Triparma laevis f. inornata]|uniref:TNFR-Cys domain-containing protein n=1 Tax=Triparma laevis f. inornata TaxID=1714386 RepID=A0A9W7AJ33_9STRA|nr:hypothetical protein TL16_g06118 [Triparma laevis f. inornata]
MHDSAEDCRECNPGYYSNDPNGASTCTLCPNDMVSSSGASVCSACPAGYDCSGGETVICDPGKYSNGDTAGCVPTDHNSCLPGSYQPSTSQSSCLACPPGKYQNHEGQDACINCPPGFFCPERTVHPIKCGSVALFCPLNSETVDTSEEGYYTTPLSTETITRREGQAICEVGFACVGGVKFPCDGIGQYADEQGLSACKTATAGYRPNDNHDGVVPCTAGTYSIGGTSECTPCDPDKFSAAAAAGCTSFKSCGAGTFVSSPGNSTSDVECEDCPAGKASTGTQTTCDECNSDGQYADEQGLSACKTATAGHHPNGNRDGLNPCPAQTYSIGGSDTCSACPAGTHSKEGSAGCISCRQYMYYDEIKQECICEDTFITVDKKCTCEAGKTLINGICKECEDGRFKNHTGTDSCNVCDTKVIHGAFETLNGTDKSSAASCACGKGKFHDPRKPQLDTPEGKCEDCMNLNLPEGVSCDPVGLTLASLPLKDGYWRSSSQSDNIVKCEIDQSCVHASPEDNCTIGHTGPICSVCTEGYSKNAVGVCKSCSSASVSIGFYTLCVVLGITALYFVLRKIFGKEKLTISNVTQVITKASSDDKHWSKRLKTKAKILTSFYQIVSRLPSTLSIQYPDFYRGFTTAINSVFNFNAIGLISVGCVLPHSMYSFYGTFLVTTLTPIILSLLLFLITALQRRKLDPYAANKLTANRFSLFYGFTYLTFASTSTMSFSTFQCTKYGDDETEWLIADRSIDCSSDFHQKFMILSVLMILVYPIGITALYSYELWKHQEGIKDAEKREGDQSIQHIVFLWRDYRAEYWWFEIYECFRRLSFTGMLVFFDPGSAPQLCFSIILALMSSLMYAYHQPFEKLEENTLAQISTVSIFLTLLAGILITLKENLDEEYKANLGALLVFVNTLVFAMVGVGVLFKPVFKFIQKFNEKHVHDAPLKGMGPEVAYSVDLFIDYFKKLSKSDEKEAGWKPLDAKDWSGKTKKVKEWLEETGVKAEWRCADGNGPIDQARVRYVVDADIEMMMSAISSIKNTHSMAVGSFMYIVEKGKDWRQIYRAVKLPWPLRQRDVVFTEHTRRDPGGDVLVCSRSSRELSDSTRELSVKAGRMRAELRVGGYRLRGAGSGKTEIVCLIDMDLGGSFAFGYLYRRMSQAYLKGVVDMHREFAEKSKREKALSDPPPPLPILSKALAAATNPMFAGLNNADSSVGDSVNIEMGRMIKKKVSKSDDDENKIYVL